MIEYIYAYINRPTVVAMDMLLLSCGIAVFVGVLMLKRKIDDLNVAISILKKRIGG